MKISYSQVESYCNEMHKIASEMKQMVETIQGVGKTVAESSAWEGESSAHYAEKLKSLTTAFDEIYIELENAVLFMILIYLENLFILLILFESNF